MILWQDKNLFITIIIIFSSSSILLKSSHTWEL